MTFSNTVALHAQSVPVRCLSSSLAARSVMFASPVRVSAIPRRDGVHTGNRGYSAPMTSWGYTLSSEEHSPRELVRQALVAEELGFDFLTISDHFHPWIDAQGHSPFV